MKNKEKNAISLIVLVITILVLSILAATVIISLSNTNIISETSKAVFKSDMSSYKEAYEMYIANELAKNAEFDRNSLNLTYQDDEFSEIFGDVEDEYKEGLKVIGGKLVYESTDELENEMLEQIGMKIEYISKDTSYVGCFADVDGDGTVDGVIFADLCIGGEGTFVDDNGEYNIPKEDKTTIKEYYISKGNYVVPSAKGYGTHPVLTAIGSGNDRFYVMALENVNAKTRYCWYATAFDDGISEYSTITSKAFGAGKQNTQNMIIAWNDSKYGIQNGNDTYLDMWGVIQDKVYGGEEKILENVKWFVPSSGELAAFAASLGENLTTSNYTTDYGLDEYYYTSSLNKKSYALRFFVSASKISNLEINKANHLRLVTIF